jgi:hypothetical protein
MHFFRTFLLFCLISLGSATVFAQDIARLINEIAYEGVTMYKMDQLVQNSADYIYDQADMSRLRGYVSFKEGETFHCIYWNGAYDNLEVIHHFSTDEPERPELMRAENKKRPLTDLEQKYYDMKMQAITYIRGEPDFFSVPNGLRLNIYFVTTREGIKGYVMPTTTQEDLIPLGNDYVFLFDKNGELQGYDHIHKQYTEIETSKMKSDPGGEIQTVQSIGNSAVPHITPTEICNLLIYSPQPEVHEHYVISDRFVSIFSLKERSLVIVANPNEPKN